jgi:hypothetical protein
MDDVRWGVLQHEGVPLRMEPEVDTGSLGLSSNPREGVEILDDG